MNWTPFLLWLAGAYALYYFTLVLTDLARTGSPQVRAAGHELTFSEQHAPHDAALLLQEEPAPSAQNHGAPDMIASGGVPLREIFGLARKEAIVYLKEVSFN